MAFAGIFAFCCLRFAAFAFCGLRLAAGGLRLATPMLISPR
jgi:hypothetical protein